MTRILIAQTRQAVGAACRRFLAGCGCEVEWATNGAECLACLGQVLPDVLILDLDLPSGGADRVLRWLHRVGPWQVLPAVILTGRASSNSVSGLLLTSPMVEAYFQEPVSLSVLVEVVRSAAAAARRRERQGTWPGWFLPQGPESNGADRWPAPGRTGETERETTMASLQETDGQDRLPPGWADAGVELPLLVTDGECAALERAAAEQGLTIGQLLRRLVSTHLAQRAEKGPAERRSSDATKQACHSDGR
jgi:CheY-like chemotaxis protein